MVPLPQKKCCPEGERHDTRQHTRIRRSSARAIFFGIVDKGLPSQHRELKPGKSETEFNQRHSRIWKNHEAELIQKGYRKPEPERPLGRDLAAEFDDLKIKLKAKGVIE